MSFLLAAICYLGLSGGVVDHSAGGSVRAGVYADEFFAVEVEAGRYEQHTTGAVGALWRWQGAEIYNRFFGYSKFDPFFTVGVPKAGVGAFYYLDDNWAIRADIDARLDLETWREVWCSASIGLQYDF